MPGRVDVRACVVGVGRELTRHSGSCPKDLPARRFLTAFSGLAGAISNWRVPACRANRTVPFSAEFTWAFRLGQGALQRRWTLSALTLDTLSTVAFVFVADAALGLPHQTR